MQIHHYDKDTGEYLSTTTARKDPLTGDPLTPAHATEETVPEVESGQCAVFDGEGWSVVEDHRGGTVWNARGVPVTIAELGPVPDGYYPLEPTYGEYSVWDSGSGEWAEDIDSKSAAVRAERDRLLTDCDWTQLADSPLNENGKTLWAAYRQELRDVPGQGGFPFAVTWPTEPETESEG